MYEKAQGEEGHAWRRGDWVFFRTGSLQVNKINQEVTKMHQEIADEIGISASRTEQPAISEFVQVLNVPLRQCYQILLHRVNSGYITDPQAQLVKLSERRFAPYRACELWLATPAHYRKIESVDTHIADPHDGRLTKDATPWIKQNPAVTELVSSLHNLRASVTFSSTPDEPWIYCTSMSPTSGREEAELRARFPNYDALTMIEDPAAFAMQLGIDFASSIDKHKHIELGPIDELVYERNKYTVSLWEGERRVDKVVRVYHGPVVYEDQSGVLRSDDDFVDFSMVPKGWFTKKTRHAGEREYRFAVSTLGRPRMDTFKLGISDELRLLVTKV